MISIIMFNVYNIYSTGHPGYNCKTHYRTYVGYTFTFTFTKFAFMNLSSLINAFLKLQLSILEIPPGPVPPGSNSNLLGIPHGVF